MSDVGILDAPDWGNIDYDRADLRYIAGRRMWATEMVPLMRGLGEQDPGTWMYGTGMETQNAVDAAIQAAVAKITGQMMMLVVVEQVVHSVFVSPTNGAPWLLVTVVTRLGNADQERLIRKQWRREQAAKGQVSNETTEAADAADTP